MGINHTKLLYADVTKSCVFNVLKHCGKAVFFFTSGPIPTSGCGLVVSADSLLFTADRCLLVEHKMWVLLTILIYSGIMCPFSTRMVFTQTKHSDTGCWCVACGANSTSWLTVDVSLILTWKPLHFLLWFLIILLTCISAPTATFSKIWKYKLQSCFSG